MGLWSYTKSRAGMEEGRGVAEQWVHDRVSPKNACSPDLSRGQECFRTRFHPSPFQREIPLATSWFLGDQLLYLKFLSKDQLEGPAPQKQVKGQWGGSKM
jgi:hypothetical protein